jgi:hypothetical protein
VASREKGPVAIRGRKAHGVAGDAIPLDVAQSMAFEREAVDVASLRSLLARIAPPDTSIQRGAFSPTRQ